MLHSVLSDTDYGSGHNTIDKTGFDKTILYLIYKDWSRTFIVQLLYICAISFMGLFRQLDNEIYVFRKLLLFLVPRWVFQMKLLQFCNKITSFFYNNNTCFIIFL